MEIPSLRDIINKFWNSETLTSKLIEAIENGADLNERFFNHWGIVENIKVESELLQLIKLMEDKGYKFPNIIIFGLLKQGYFNCIDYFLNSGYDLNVLNGEGENALFYLVSQSVDINKFSAILDKAIKLGLDYKKLNSHNWNLIHKAVYKGISEQYVEELCKLDLNINLRDIDGWTPLHLAAYFINPEYCAVLIKYGADKSLKTHRMTSIGEFDTPEVGQATAYQLYKKINIFDNGDVAKKLLN